MNQTKTVVFAFVFIVILILINASVFTVREGLQAVITRMGRPIRQVTEAGLHFKTPFIEEARFVDKRILIWDGDVERVPTKDKKYILVDTTARWRVTDALKFIQAVQNEYNARTRIDAVLDGATRDTISNHNLVEAVRNSNNIIQRIREREEKLKKAGGDAAIEEEITGEIEKVTDGREKLSQIIAERAKKDLEKFGIELLDVQLRRIAYEESVEAKVYDRMISERERIAEKIRSIGKGEKAKIQGKTARDLKKIQSQAYRKAKIVEGKADAEATRIFARSFGKDPKFYEFIRTMEAYRTSLKEDTEFILSSDSEFLRMMKRGR